MRQACELLPPSSKYVSYMPRLHSIHSLVYPYVLALAVLDMGVYSSVTYGNGESNKVSNPKTSL